MCMCMCVHVSVEYVYMQTNVVECTDSGRHVKKKGRCFGLSLARSCLTPPDSDQISPF